MIAHTCLHAPDECPCSGKKLGLTGIKQEKEKRNYVCRWSKYFSVNFTLEELELGGTLFEPYLEVLAYICIKRDFAAGITLTRADDDEALAG
jgi:hypothetical protein